MNERIVVIPDTHHPYQDEEAIQKVLKFIKDYKPTKIIMLGDHVDFYALSRFDKDPERITSLQGEIDSVQSLFKDLRKVFKGDITYLEGNHEYRLIKYLMRNPEISSLKNLNTVPALLGLKEYGIKYKKMEIIHSVIFKHGDIVRRYSGYTARGEFENEGTSGISGHTHRIGSHYHTNRNGQPCYRDWETQTIPTKIGRAHV